MDKYEKMANRLEEYSSDLEKMNCIYLDTIVRGLSDPYDAIICEAIDYILEFGKVDDFSNSILNICTDDQPDFIKGRLLICAAKSNNIDLKNRIKALQFDKNDKYNSIWFNAAQFLIDKNNKYISEIRKLSNDNDQTVASLAQSLLESAEFDYQLR